MKFNFSNFLGFTIILLLGVVFAANAQEGIPSNEIPDLNFLQPDYQIQDEKTLLFDPANGTERNSQSREHIIAVPKSNKTKSEEGSKNLLEKPEEEDALSFNFLYYIIQKFKISDIVEQ